MRVTDSSPLSIAIILSIFSISLSLSFQSFSLSLFLSLYFFLSPLHSLIISRFQNTAIYNNPGYTGLRTFQSLRRIHDVTPRSKSLIRSPCSLTHSLVVFTHSFLRRVHPRIPSPYLLTHSLPIFTLIPPHTHSPFHSPYPPTHSPTPFPLIFTHHIHSVVQSSQVGSR